MDVGDKPRHQYQERFTSIKYQSPTQTHNMKVDMERATKVGVELGSEYRLGQGQIRGWMQLGLTN